MSDELKPCPFCGGAAELSEDKNYERYRYFLWVHCTGPTCPLHFEYDLTYHATQSAVDASRADLVSAWNRRAANQDAVARLTSLFCAAARSIDFRYIDDDVIREGCCATYEANYRFAAGREAAIRYMIRAALGLPQEPQP